MPFAPPKNDTQLWLHRSNHFAKLVLSHLPRETKNKDFLASRLEFQIETEKGIACQIDRKYVPGSGTEKAVVDIALITKSL